jgi:hypothetical protein
MSQASLWSILEAYGIPGVDLLKSFTGVAQGSVLSPVLFSLFINVLFLYLSDIGRKKRIHLGLPGTHPFNHILFTDDVTLLTQDTEDMQTLLNAIQKFEKWNGIPVNTLKTKQTTVDVIEDNRSIIEELTNHDKPLPISPESECQGIYPGSPVRSETSNGDVLGKDGWKF